MRDGNVQDISFKPIRSLNSEFFFIVFVDSYEFYLFEACYMPYIVLGTQVKAVTKKTNISGFWIIYLYIVELLME